MLPANDPDAGSNGTVVEYGIENTVAEFDLIYEHPELLYLEVRQPLDRESKQLVVMNISAKDGGVPARSVHVRTCQTNASDLDNCHKDAWWIVCVRKVALQNYSCKNAAKTHQLTQWDNGDLRINGLRYARRGHG